VFAAFTEAIETYTVRRLRLSRFLRMNLAGGRETEVRLNSNHENLCCFPIGSDNYYGLRYSMLVMSYKLSCEDSSLLTICKVLKGARRVLEPRYAILRVLISRCIPLDRVSCLDGYLQSWK
jgi:hypothetical protein